MTDTVRSDDVARLLFDAYALIEHVRSAAPARVDTEAWRSGVGGRAEAMWNSLVGAFYGADPEGFREAITAIIGAAAPLGQQLQDPEVALTTRAVLVEELMREFSRSVLPHTDENGVLRPEVAIGLDRALVKLRRRQELSG